MAELVRAGYWCYGVFGLKGIFFFFFFFLSSFKKKDLWGKSWFQLVTLDKFFLEGGVGKPFISLTHFKTVNSLLKLFLGQERESTTAQSPRRSPVLSAFKSLALIPELEYGNSGAGRNIMSQGNLPLRAAVNISAVTLFQTVVVAVLMCFCSACFKHLLVVAFKVIPKPCLSNTRCSPKGFAIPAPGRTLPILKGRFIWGMLREGSQFFACLHLSCHLQKCCWILCVCKQQIFHSSVAVLDGDSSHAVVTGSQCHMMGSF